MNVKRVCVAFNGPPGIGKDTLAVQIKRMKPFIGMGAFADAVRLEAAEYLGIPEFVEWATSQETKDKPMYQTGTNTTPRQFLAVFSANKKKHEGEDVFFKRSIQDAAEHSNYLFTDLGFPYEAEHLEDHFDAVVIIQLHHADFNFEKDVRQYVRINTDKTKTVDFIVNRKDPECMKNAVGIVELIHYTVEEILCL